jgi:RimJ/RimL family protein N-acetyltransferase
MNLAGPPFPYGRKEWDDWSAILERASKDTLAEWREVEKTRKEGGNGRQWVNGAPVTAIREVDPVTGEQKFIGSIDVTRHNYTFHGVHEENQRKQDENDALAAGNPEIDWSVGCESCPLHSSYDVQNLLIFWIDYLAPSHHGRGIMSVALNTLLHDFCVPYMNAHLVTVSYFEHNPASRKVLERNGFVFDQMKPDFFELPETKTGVKGKKVGIGFVKWIRTS